MNIEYELPKHKQPFFNFVKGIMKLFFRKIKIVNFGGELENKCLYLINHANKNGPILYELRFPVYNVKWGAHQMLGNYSDRRRYLRDVLYIQKNGYKKATASFKATFEAFFSPFFYKGMKMLPTYTDAKLIRTVKKSVDILRDDTALMIFPEDSNAGYFDAPTKFFPGFVLVMDKYFKTCGEDVPVRVMYFNKKKRILAVGESVYLSDFKGLDREEIAEEMRLKMLELKQKTEL